MTDTRKVSDNNVSETSNNMTARSKVMQNWSSSWHDMPVPQMPNDDNVRPSTPKHESTHKTNTNNSGKTVKKTKENGQLLSVKNGAESNKLNKSLKSSNNDIEYKPLNNDLKTNVNERETDNRNNNDITVLKRNLRKRKLLETTAHSETIGSNNQIDCEKTVEISKLDESESLNIDINMDSNDSKLDVNDVHESLDMQTCCIYHYPLTHPLPYPFETISLSVNLNKTNKMTKSEIQIKAQKVVKKSRIIQAQKKNLNTKKRNLKPTLQLLTFTKPNVKPVEYRMAFNAFVEQKFIVKDNTPFFQDRSCTNCPSGVSLCLDCKNSELNDFVRMDSQTCRFYQYRTLIKRDGYLSVYAFAEQGNATPEDTKIWLPWNKPNLDESTAKFLLTYVSEQFCQIYREEFNVIGENQITWKKPVKGVRELCDLCETTIFNTHWVCPVCGYAVCIDCFQLRKESELNNKCEKDWRREVRDEYNWLFCSTKERHELMKFHLALFITKAVFAALNTSLHITRNRLEIRGKCDCGHIDDSLRTDFAQIIPSVSELKSMYSHIPHQWFCDNRLLVLNEPRNPNNINLFQIHWIRGDPAMVENVNDILDNDLWTPNAFNRDFGKQMSRLVNCMNGAIIPKKPMKYFWDGFEDINERMKDQETGEQMLLKLKDWPPNAEFRDKLPKRFANLMDCLPLPEYTRYDGIRNLSTRLPEFFVRPDLGPKLYCAYGSVMHADKGTTNLHLDMSDAINVMIYVGIAINRNDDNPDKTSEDQSNQVIESLIRGGCDEQMINRVRDSNRKVGALWHIFAAKDANKIRSFLTTIAMESGMKIELNNDPIHDQCWYLDEKLRQRLLHDYGVMGFSIAQCLGDAILIPAGAPHQVRNVHSCIKVAGEFVSPENVSHCVSLTQEFRKLSRRHNNHEDKLQIKNIIYHTVKDSIACLLPKVF